MKQQSKTNWLIVFLFGIVCFSPTVQATVMQSDFAASLRMKMMVPTNGDDMAKGENL